ncbi:predicted protein [Methanosarcina acetivorans C2A]|uniref:Uncharacterized protein n=1 Tax=Methanosarcina acetivorans (strain ATCC 35395 / DSM 2834 / JCM 12185 / C2A) TaxID=188937 RepID=Q8TPG1_METAC|nr:predicted protein [Methanosarcina acetivorans C2A]
MILSGYPKPGPFVLLILPLSGEPVKSATQKGTDNSSDNSYLSLEPSLKFTDKYKAPLPACLTALRKKKSRLEKAIKNTKYRHGIPTVSYFTFTCWLFSSSFSSFSSFQSFRERPLFRVERKRTTQYSE